jgi:L-lactate dehydrogenase (cytochrome)
VRAVKAAAVMDYRELARRRLPRFLFEYIDGGSYAEVTLRRNVADLESVALRQRVLCDVSKLDLTAELFGMRLAMPIALGPVGIAGLNARRGEVQAARAAERAGVPFCLSTVSACPLAEVARALQHPFWFQLYMMRDRAFLRDLLDAAAAHCSVLLFTVDLPVPGARYRDVRSGLSESPGVLGALRRAGQGLLRPRWVWDVAVRGRPFALGNLTPVMGRNRALSDFFGWTRENFDDSVTWKDLDWVRQHWKGPLIIKGILDPTDARLAADLGAEGIVVSNHGGRQLDGTPSTVRALPAIAAAVGERLTVLVDGGVRSGLDVVRMLALGAKGVLLGRAWVYALGGRGEAGVTHMLELIAQEMRVALALTGCTRVRDISRELLVESA